MSQTTNEAIQTIKDALNQTADACGAMAPYLEDAEIISKDVERIASTVIQLEKYTKDLQRSVQVLTDVCYVLGGIPIIGTIASRIPSVLKPVNTPIKVINQLAKDCKPVLESIKNSTKNLSKECALLKKDAQFANNHFKNYANSLEMLSSCLALLEGINQLISSAQTQSRLTSLMNGLESDVEVVCSDIVKAKQEIQSLKNTLLQINNEFRQAADPFMKVSDTVNKAFKSVSSFISPITNAFNKVINAISPLKWLLKAVSWLVKKILNPIIDKILGWLGLDTLLNKISKKISEVLHVDELTKHIEKIEKQISEVTVGQLTQSIHNIQNGFTAQYSQLDHLISLDTFEADLFEFLQDAYKEFSEQELPDWPMKEMNMDISIQIHCEPFIPTKCLLPVYDDSSMYVVKADEALVQDYHESISQNFTKINDVISNLDGVYDKWKAMQNQMILCNKYTQDILLYESLVDNLSSCISLFSGITYFESINGVVDQLNQKLMGEKTKIQNLKTCMDNCQQQYAATYDRFMSAYQALPDQSDVDSLYGTLLRVEDSYQSTITTIDASQLEDKSAMVKLVDTRFDDYLAKVENFNQELSQCEQNLMLFCQKIEEMTDNIGNLSNNENEIIDSQFYQSLSSVNQYLAAIHSILLPAKQILLFILNKEEDKAKDFILSLKNFVDRIAQVLEKILQTTIFDDFMELILPFEEMASQVNHVTESIKGVDFTIMDGFRNDLEGAKQYLQPIYQYQDEEGNVVNDLYIDQAMRQALIQAGMSEV